MTPTDIKQPPRARPSRRTRLKRTPSGRLLLKLYDSYVLRRVGRAIFTIWVIATGVFFMVRLLPGNPVSTYIGKLTAEGQSYEAAAAAAASLYTFDPNTPMWQQYLDYLWGVCRLDLGTTLSRVPVIDKIADTLPWTLFSVGLGLLLAVIVGLLLGMAMAYRRGGILDTTASAVGSILHSIPNYLVALIIVTVGATQLELFDYADMRGTITPGVTPGFTLVFLGDALYHAILPVFTYFITTAGTWALLMKASTTQVLGEDYVMVARARGLGGRRIGSAYVGRNAVLPVVAQIATKAGFVVGGAIFVELIFNYEGIGITLYNAVDTRDYALTQGILLIITITVVFANLVSDLTYGMLDPRIRTSGKEVER